MKDLGRIAFEAFKAAVPDSDDTAWEDQPAEFQRAWEAAAQSVANSVLPAG